MAVVSKTDIRRKIKKKNQICLENESKTYFKSHDVRITVKSMPCNSQWIKNIPLLRISNQSIRDEMKAININEIRTSTNTMSSIRHGLRNDN